MYVVCVQVHVKPEYVDDFIKATRENYQCTRKDEPGNVRWDLLQSEDDLAQFLIYEVYQEKDDFTKHQQTSHYQKWKATVADWMAEPRVGIKYANIYPADNEWNL